MTEVSTRRIDSLIQVALVGLLAIGCWLILRPFFTAILLAMVLAVSTWPAYLWLYRALKERYRSASVIACMLVVLCMITPALLVMKSFTDGASWLHSVLEAWFAAGPPQLPQWLSGLPILGPVVQDYWREVIASPDTIRSLLRQLLRPTRELVLASGRALGVGLFQFVLSVLVLYFLYRDGVSLGARLKTIAERVGGAVALELVGRAKQTVVGVMVSVIGAGLAQAMVATAGFAIAGVPQPFLLGTLTFVLSLVPWGPVVIWVGASVWLFQSGETGWAVFMLIYGWLGISSVDNILKPFLISRTSHLPFVLTVMGVMGGVLAFGVVGLFLGPTLLALAINLSTHWLARKEAVAPYTAAST